MKMKQAAYRAGHMLVKTDKTGERLTITYRNRSLVMPSREMGDLCLWLMGAMNITAPRPYLPEVDRLAERIKRLDESLVPLRESCGYQEFRTRQTLNLVRRLVAQKNTAKVPKKSRRKKGRVR